MKIKIVLLVAFLLVFFTVPCMEKIHAIDDPNILTDEYKNYDDDYVSCGSGLMTDIPSSIPKVTHIVYIVIMIAVPVVLVLFGMLDLIKGVAAQKEDEIKKGQQILIKRLIAAALVFFVFTIVKLVIDFAGDNSSGKIISCTECFINNKCAKVVVPVTQQA